MREPERAPGSRPATRRGWRTGAWRVRLLACFVLLLLCAEAGVLGRTLALRSRGAAARAEGSRIAGSLGLTDLAIWTEARYTRHPALADGFSAFQDHPGALEHFPAGSVLAAPPHLDAAARAARP